jgi:hypothetical protein
MAKILFANNASSTITGAISEVALTVSLASGSGAIFPQPGPDEYFIATFIDQATGTQREIVHVTNITNDQATIVRAQENTARRAWSTGDIFAHLHTAGAMQAFLQGDMGYLGEENIIHVGQDVGVPGVVQCPTSPPATAYINGMQFNIMIANTNDGDMVANFDNLGQLPVLRLNGNQLRKGDLIRDLEMIFVYSDGHFVIPVEISLEDIGEGGTGTYPADFWAGQMIGSLAGATIPNQFLATVDAHFTSYYPGLIISGLTTVPNTGAIEISVNSGPFVPLIHMDGSPFVGGFNGGLSELPHVNTLMMMQFEGHAFRAIGSFEYFQGNDPGGGGEGGGGGTPPVWKYGDDTSCYLDILPQSITPFRRSNPTSDRFISSFNVTNQQRTAYGSDWISTGSIPISWENNTFNCQFFQKGTVFPGTFTLGDVGSFWIEFSGNGASNLPAGFRDTQTEAGGPKSNYGTTWLELCKFGYETAFIISFTTYLNFFQRVPNGDTTYATYGARGSLYCDMSRSPGYVAASGTVPGYGNGVVSQDTFYRTRKKMATYPGTWNRIATISAIANVIPQINTDLVMDIYQRLL